MMGTDLLASPREQLLIVSDPGDLGRFVRGRYPQFEVAVSPDYLAGITAVAQHRTGRLLVGVNPGCRKLDSAIAGLRKAAGPDSRIVLCCTPSGEPLTRQVLATGADDYLIYPPTGDELDNALDVTVGGPVAGDLTPSATMPSWDELTDLAAVLAQLRDGRRPMLDRLCALIANSMRVPFVRVRVDRDDAHVGDRATEPILEEPITAGGRSLGTILVGPRQRDPFSAAEVEKLRHYSRLIGHLVEAAEQQQEWQRLAMIDEVSQLPNRRYLMQALKSLVHRSAHDRSPLTVLMFDLDGFKHFNDTYGHGAGDEIIRDTGQLFRRHCRQSDIVARYAGDEFVVVFWDADGPRVVGSRHPTDALAVLRRFKKSLEAHAFPKLGPEATGCITISGGLATFPWDAKDAEGLIERADEAMLLAKRDGKNRIYLVGAEGEPAEEAGD